TEPTAAQNIGYSDLSRHGYWHYIDLPFSPDGTPLEQPIAPNAATQIAAFRAALSAPDTTDEVKSYDLVWLLHLVGDVHQPLHCATRVRQSDPDGDAGGNGVAVRCAACPERLHAFWDGVFAPGSSTPSAVINVAQALPAPDPTL